MSRAAHSETLEDGLDRLVRVTGVSREELDDVVTRMRAIAWHGSLKFLDAAEILETLDLAFAAAYTRAELAEEQAARSARTT